jgi:CubicO group peptidase (beta-lactamase class C family)
VASNGRIIHRAAYGHANLANGTAFTTETPSYIASIGKLFTAVGILRLVDAGRLSLDMPLGTALPSAPAYAHQVTLAQILTHTSGLVDHFDIGGEGRSYTTADVLKILADADSLLFSPGARNRYSNSGYELLAQVIERATGLSYRDFLQQEFFGPLGMRSTTVADGTVPLAATRALGYRNTTTGWELHDYHSTTRGAGGIYSSVDDLYRFWAALREGRLLSTTSLDRARTMQRLTDGRGTPYGMGWLAESDGRGALKDKKYVAAVGQLRGFWSLLKWYFHDDLVIIWTSNAAENTAFDGLTVIPSAVLAP